MSFRVNTNVSAMNALRSVSLTGNEFGKAMTRLSTGLRINSAADDPAGLIISENFRAQISGIEQAIRNNQDASNYAKTAEGALDEVNRLLRDARSLAVASNNSGVLSASQLQANQSQFSSIVSSISRIATQTQFGSKRLLDGSAGVQASVTSSANVSNMYFSGTFNNAALTTNSAVTVTVTTAATQANLTGSVTYASGTFTVAAGSFSINGRTFTTTAATTVNEVVASINGASDATGVVASHTSGGIVLRSNTYGSAGNFALVDATGIINAAGTSTNATGTDAVANVVVDTDGSGSGTGVTVVFTGGRFGSNGLTISDNNGNRIVLTAGATTNAFAAGNLTVGTAKFQVGANADQTASLSIGNFDASQLGRGTVAGLSLSNLDLTTSAGATDALKVIDSAIEEVAKSRGDIGNFQRNILESNIRSLGVAKENLVATESAIRDVDIASEMTNYTKLQILQQTGLSVLAQANAAPQSVLSLLR